MLANKDCSGLRILKQILITEKLDFLRTQLVTLPRDLYQKKTAQWLSKLTTEIENLFDLSSCEHDSYSSSAVCHFARVLYKKAWISIDWQITFLGDRLTPKRLSWPMTFYAGPSMQAPPLPFPCSPRAVFKKLTGACYAGYGYSSHNVSLSWQLETKLNYT